MKQETFEKKLEHAKAIVEKLGDPEITLEKAMALYEEGVTTIKEAQKMLEEAQAKIETIRAKQRSENEDEANEG